MEKKHGEVQEVMSRKQMNNPIQQCRRGRGGEEEINPHHSLDAAFPK